MHLFSKIVSWMMCNIHISDGTFQRGEAKADTYQLREVAGVPPWSLGSISLPNYGNAHTLLGNSTSMCYYTTDFWYICCPPASATTVLFCQSFPNAVLTEVSPFSSSPFALPCSADTQHQFSQVASLRACTMRKKRKISLILLQSLQRQELSYNEADCCITLHF